MCKEREGGGKKYEKKNKRDPSFVREMRVHCTVQCICSELSRLSVSVGNHCIKTLMHFLMILADGKIRLVRFFLIYLVEYLPLFAKE